MTAANSPSGPAATAKKPVTWPQQLLAFINWRALLIGGITLLVALTVLLLLNREQSGQNQFTSSPLTALQQTRSDYFMEGVVSRHFDQNGQLSHVLAAPRIDYFLAQRRSLMQQPHIQLSRPGGSPWDVRAANAEADHQAEQLQLRGNVTLNRAGQDGVAALQMETEQLAVDLQARTAATDDSIRFTSPGGQVTATGLRANLATEQLQLLANVKGLYEPPPHEQAPR